MVGSSQALLPSRLYVPWTTKINMGDSFNYLENSFSSSALGSIEEVPASGHQDSTFFKFVTNEEELSQLITASVEGSGNVEDVEVKASLAFTHSVSFSETSISLIFTWVSDLVGFDKLKSPKLSAEALELSKSNPDGFRIRYGDYFVSGGLQRVEFHAVYQLSGQTRAELMDLKASTEVSSPDLFSAKGTAEFSQKASSKRVSISATVYKSANVSDNSVGTSPNLTPAQVLAMFDDFRKNLKPSRAVAELTHYNDIAPGIDRAVSVPPDFFSDRARFLAAKSAYDSLLNGLLLPSQLAKTLKTRQLALSTKWKAMGSLYWKNPQQLADDRKDAETLAVDARTATNFLRSVQVLGATDGGRSNLIGRSGGEAGIGMHGDLTKVPADVELRTDSFDLKGDWVSGHLTKSVDKNYPGCTIVYIKAHNNWPQDQGGELNGFSGGIGLDHVHLGCTADFDRGLSWSFVVKYVESEKG